MNGTVSRKASEVGQRVRFTGYGGEVRRYHVGMEGTVVGFTVGGYPIVQLDRLPSGYLNPKPRIVDRWGCGLQLDADGLIAWFPISG